MGGKAFVITGQVVGSTSRGMLDLRVGAWGKDHSSDQSTAGAESDAGGRFRIELRQQQRMVVRRRSNDAMTVVRDSSSTSKPAETS